MKLLAGVVPKAGVKELVKAEKHQKSSRMMLCIMFLFCACIVMILVVMFQKLM